MTRLVQNVAQFCESRASDPDHSGLSNLHARMRCNCGDDCLTSESTAKEDGSERWVGGVVEQVEDARAREQAQERFRKLRAAYEVLRDPGRRADYDHGRTDPSRT